MYKNILLFFAILSVSTSVVGDSFTSYNTTKAAEYAKNNSNIPYNIKGRSSEFYNPFADYANYGGNCTNFVSQSILGGMIGTNKTYKAYKKRYDFDADRYSYGNRWYYIYNSTQSGRGLGRGEAWSEAESLKQYADKNKLEYKGLHLQYVTHDNKIDPLLVNKIKVGDIIFADWTMDGVRDHSMVVTKINPHNSSYYKIFVTYQNGVDEETGTPYEIRTNFSLGKLNRMTNYATQFVVYRPINYNPHGI